MKFDGNFYNPFYDGEGFSFKEYSDGKVIGNFYTYWMGEQMWFICVGDRVGDSVTLAAIRTIGGHLGDIKNPENAKEIPWGTISLMDNGDGTIDMTYRSNDDSISGGYTISELHRPEENNDEITIQKWHIDDWISVGQPPLSSTVQFHRRLAKVRNRIWKFRVVVNSGTLNISNILNNGPYDPKIEIMVDGVKSDKRSFSAEEEFEIDCYLGPVNQTGSREWSSFIIDSSEHGRFFNVWAMILSS